jgi:hypothetical protein
MLYQAVGIRLSSSVYLICFDTGKLLSRENHSRGDAPERRALAAPLL